MPVLVGRKIVHDYGNQKHDQHTDQYLSLIHI